MLKLNDRVHHFRLEQPDVSSKKSLLMSLAKGGDTAIAHATVFMYITAQD
jgi:hypothetical protein